jgi:hypothetical protein
VRLNGPAIDIHGMAPAEAARLRASARVSALLDGRAPDAAAAQVIFADDDDPTGGPATRCAVTVSLLRRGRLHVEAFGITAHQALDGALDQLERRLEQTTASARARRRGPGVVAG